MAVHVFPIESVRQSLLGGDSIEHAYRMARMYLSQHSQSGETTDTYMNCADVAAVEGALSAFPEWASSRTETDPKVLWLSLHGKPPENPAGVGTEGLSASYRVDLETEVVQWERVFVKLRGIWPANTVVLSDVCWGASPTAPARMTDQGSANPALFFGPLRKAHRLELDSAAGLVFGLLSRGTVPEIEDAKAVVDEVNHCFPLDAVNGKPFYRVWWWDSSGQSQRHPDATEHRICPSHVVPSA